MAKNTQAADVEVLVCVKCLAGQAVPEGGIRPGQALFNALPPAPDGTRFPPVGCLQNCDAGCTVAYRGGPARWSYVYGNFDLATDAPLLAEAASLYRDTAEGLIPWRSRPEHLKRNCVARILPLEAPHD